jgi:hypothetical protein
MKAYVCCMLDRPNWVGVKLDLIKIIAIFIYPASVHLILVFPMIGA